MAVASGAAVWRQRSHGLAATSTGCSRRRAAASRSACLRPLSIRGRSRSPPVHSNRSAALACLTRNTMVVAMPEVWRPARCRGNRNGPPIPLPRQARPVAWARLRDRASTLAAISSTRPVTMNLIPAL